MIHRRVVGDFRNGTHRRPGSRPVLRAIRDWFSDRLDCGRLGPAAQRTRRSAAYSWHYGMADLVDMQIVDPGVDENIAKLVDFVLAQ